MPGLTDYATGLDAKDCINHIPTEHFDDTEPAEGGEAFAYSDALAIRNLARWMKNQQTTEATIRLGGSKPTTFIAVGDAHVALAGGVFAAYLTTSNLPDERRHATFKPEALYELLNGPQTSELKGKSVTLEVHEKDSSTGLTVYLGDDLEVLGTVPSAPTAPNLTIPDLTDRMRASVTFPKVRPLRKYLDLCNATVPLIKVHANGSGAILHGLDLNYNTPTTNPQLETTEHVQSPDEDAAESNYSVDKLKAYWTGLGMTREAALIWGDDYPLYVVAEPKKSMGYESGFLFGIQAPIIES